MANRLTSLLKAGTTLSARAGTRTGGGSRTSTVTPSIPTTPWGTRSWSFEVQAQPSGLGWLPDGDLLVVSMKDRRVLRRSAGGGVSTHAQLFEETTGHLNDMIVDDQGRAFVGNFGFDLMGGGRPAPASLVRIDPDGATAVAATDLWFPNGMMITDDGTLIVAETFAARLTAFDIQPDGSLTNRRVWAQVQPSPDPADTETMLSAVISRPTAVRWTLKATCGPPTPWARRSAASPRGVRSSTSSRRPTASASSRAGSAARTAARSSPALHRTSTSRRARRPARPYC